MTEAELSPALDLNGDAHVQIVDEEQHATNGHEEPYGTPETAEPVIEESDLELAQDVAGNPLSDTDATAAGHESLPHKEETPADTPVSAQGHPPLKPKASVTVDAKTRSTMNGATKTASGRVLSKAAPTTRPIASARPSGATSTTTRPAPSAITKKSLGSSTTAPPSKPPTVTRPSAASAPPTASRRTSAIPPLPKASTTARPSSTTSTATAKPALRASTVINKSPSEVPGVHGLQRASPTPSTTGPIKSKLSTEVGRKSVATRPSAVPTSAAPTTSKHVAGRPSISSVRSLAHSSKESPKAHDELETKLRTAEAELTAKSDQIALLEIQLAAMRNNLEEAVSQSSARTSEFESLQAAVKASNEARTTLEGELETLKKAVEDANSASHGFIQIKEELDDAKASLIDSDSKREQLASDLAKTETALAAANDIIKATEEVQSRDAEFATVEREALLKANADLHQIKSEIESLTAEHAKALDAANAKIAELQGLQESSNSANESLRSKLEALQEDLSQKISELEVDVLESRETAEKAVDDSSKEVAKLKAQHWEEKDQLTKTLQEDLERANAAHEAATKQWESASRAAEEKHSIDLAAALADAEAKANTASEAALRAFADEHASALAAKEAEHSNAVSELKTANEEAQNNLRTVIEGLSSDLAGAEAKYEARIREIKGQQDELLQKAHADAKSEAGATHAQELSKVRSESQSSLDELRTHFQRQIEELKTSHAETLEEQTRIPEKHIKELTINLAAATDDLTKSKAAVTALQTELESLKKQLEEAKQAVQAASAGADAALQEQLAQAKQEASNARDDVSTFQKLVSETHQSFAADIDGIKATHARELEELAAKQAQAVADQRSAHEQELARLSGERAELRSALEDERELKEKALSQVATLQQVRSPPTSPRNSTPSTGVSKEEIEKLHRAHNATLMTVEAEHNKELQALRDELTKREELVKEVEAAKARQQMEIDFMQEEKQEADEEIQRHLEELTELKAQLTLLKSSAA